MLTARIVEIKARLQIRECTYTTNQQKVILLLPGRRAGDKIIMFSESGEDSYLLPTNLIADDQI